MNKNRFHFREAQTQSDFEKMFALRYQVYCIENNWLPFEKYPDHLEKDEYDSCSKHFIAEDAAGDIAGTIRLILSDQLNSGQLIPIGKHPSVSADSLILSNCAEISRLVVDKRLRRGDISLGLYRIMYHFSSKYKLNYWYVAVDEIFLKILQKLGFPFQSFAEPGKYMGDTIPAKLQVTFVEQHLMQKNKPLANWFQASPYCLEENKLMSKFLSKPNKNRCVYTPETNEGLFSRNWAFIPRTIQDKLATTRLFIAGAGLGSVIAERAARTGFGKFIIADGDSVALSNLNRQVFVRKDIARNKASALSDIVHTINENAEVEVIAEYLTPDTLEQPITRSDLVINTIDFDHPGFLDCNRQAQKYGKPVLFPLNIGWGGALFIFTPDSPLLDDFLGLVPNTPYSFNQIKNKLIRKIVGRTLPDYLFSLVDVFESPEPEDWRNDPQLAIGSAISASLSVTAAVSIVSNTPVKTAPDFVYVDFNELVRKP